MSREERTNDRAPEPMTGRQAEYGAGRAPELRGYLISRFILILAVTMLAELAVYLLLWTVLGSTMKILADSYLPKNLFSDIFPWLGILALSLLGDLFPALGVIANNGIDFLEAGILHQLPDNLLSLLGQLPVWGKLLLLVLGLCLLMILLLPIAAGILWYTVLVEKKVREVEAYTRQIYEDYEKKRNLMLADIAHDLRNPITAVYGYSKALDDGIIDTPEEQKEYLGIIEEKCKRINDLIQMLLDYTKLDSLGFQLKMDRVELDELLRQNGALIYPDMEAAGMDLEVDIPENPHYYVQADSLQFSRVITNLLNNAIRHNPAGTLVWLMLEVREKELWIFVADNGTVISEELADHLFEPFAMGDRSRNSGGGSGLGLAIARRIAEMHGWELTLITDKKKLKEGWTKAFGIRIPREDKGEEVVSRK